MSASVVPEEMTAIQLKPSDIFKDPSSLMNIWVDEPVPLAFYSEEDVSMQQKINENVSDWIVTYSPVDQKHEWLDIDYEEITPYTWKWVHFDLPEAGGSVTKISLRRPHWWIKEAKADSVGRVVYINLEEMGVVGWATITNITPSQLDTRLQEENRNGDYVLRPVTGKFMHRSSNVYRLFFSGGDSVEVTANHPIWSYESNDWIEASSLQEGERVSTYSGTVKLIRISKTGGNFIVYNLETYRDHTYHVSFDRILVHNTCVIQHKIGRWMVFSDDAMIRGTNPWFKGYKTGGLKPGQNSVGTKKVQELVDKMESGDFDWLEMEWKPGVDPRIQVVRFADRIVLLNGHHRVIAAQIAKIDVPWDDLRVVYIRDMTRYHSSQFFKKGEEVLEWGNVDWE